jgi:3-methylfumaryl-CoA hydratase
VLTEAELSEWRSYVGRTEIREQLLDVESLRRYAVAVGSTRDVERQRPPIAHWAYFLDAAQSAHLGSDGHPKRGTGLLPPVRLQRRMFAASAMRFREPLELNQPAQLTLKVVDIKHRVGRSGELVLVELQRELTQQGRERLIELQTLVYRDGNETVPAVEPRPMNTHPDDALWQPGTVELFRFSAATFNSHRIHYDLAYAQADEGYPALVVHGPLTAAKLYAYAQQHSASPLQEFRFRGSAPLFVNQPIRLRRNDSDGSFEALRCDGVVAAVASVGA